MGVGTGLKINKINNHKLTNKGIGNKGMGTGDDQATRPFVSCYVWHCAVRMNLLR